MKVQLALYKGPPSSLLHNISHYTTRLFTWSNYSHAELVIDGVCYSSSARDGGVRSKIIDLSSGHWDVFDIYVSEQTKVKALSWFTEHNGDPYDYRNVVRYVLPFIGHNKKHWVCYEAIGAALGIERPHMLTAESLLREFMSLGENHEKHN